MKNFITRKRIISLAGILLLILLWQIASSAYRSEHILPSPGKTIYTAFEIIMKPEFWPSVLVTILRGLEGFGISLFLSLFIGIPAGISKSFFYFINPLLITIRSTPVISFILLAIIWFGNEQVPVFIAILTMFPVICLNVIEGIRNVDQDLVEMGRTYKISYRGILRDIYIPSIAPFLTGGISNALGFGWRAIIIGEVLSQPKWGIGARMQDAQTFLLVSELIAWTLIAIIISSLFELIVRIVEKRTIQWKKS